MYNSLDDRAIIFANYIVLTKSTIRRTAQVFGVSKSTVHNDVSQKLKLSNFKLYEQVHSILRNNFELKHLRGGEATRNKYIHRQKL